MYFVDIVIYMEVGKINFSHDILYRNALVEKQRGGISVVFGPDHDAIIFLCSLNYILIHMPVTGDYYAVSAFGD